MDEQTNGVAKLLLELLIAVKNHALNGLYFDHPLKKTKQLLA
jgi:hypothetical protein